VIVPYKEWTNLQSRLKVLEKKLKVFSSIQDGAREVGEARKSGRKLQSLSAFIDEKWKLTSPNRSNVRQDVKICESTAVA